MDHSINGKDIWSYTVKELSDMKYGKTDLRFSINEKEILGDAITCKIEGGDE